VLKFGSSVLQSRENLPKVVHEVYRWIRLQYRVVAIISAFAGETERLLKSVADYRDAQPEAIARIVATGEEVASSLVALELDRFGIPAQVLDPSQLQLIADCDSNDTEPVSVNVACLRDVLNDGRVVVVPGFIARDRRGHVALFGRGGSDLSALYLAGQLQARCRLIKDVDGIYDSDPARNSYARRYRSITCDHALAIAGKVVQQKAVRYAQAAGTSFEVAALGCTRATVVGAGQSSLAHAEVPRRPLRVGLLGLGTVGGGVFRELQSHPQLFEVCGVAVRTPERHAAHASPELLTRDCRRAVDGVDVVVELIGGTSPAGELVAEALASGTPVVTANKLLLAENPHLARHRGLRYSAAVGGAVPAVEAVRSVAQTQRVLSLAGVLNGTCNYILDRIVAGDSYKDAVVQAQANGFAEADPRADLSGADTACKLRLLAGLAFPAIHETVSDITGIENIDVAWVRSVAAEGGRVRLVATATADGHCVSLRVKPEAVAAGHPFARIRNEENCLLIQSCDLASSEVEQRAWTGRGAGRWPTTAAVMADLFDLAREWPQLLPRPTSSAILYAGVEAVAQTEGVA
jgi:homoserine dehydrogenase